VILWIVQREINRGNLSDSKRDGDAVSAMRCCAGHYHLASLGYLSHRPAVLIQDRYRQCVRRGRGRTRPLSIVWLIQNSSDSVFDIVRVM